MWSDLANIDSLDCVDFCESLCQFIPQVTKVKDGSDYHGKTLYELIVSIQKYLNQNNKPWKLIEGPEFINVKTVLDNIMKEHAANNIVLVRCQAQYISAEYEEKLWSEGVLGEQNHQQLRDTVLFLLDINLGLRAVDEHYALRRDSYDKPSQLSFERDSKGVWCLVYREDSVTKTNDGGLSSLKKECKIVWVYPCQNTVRCPVRIVDKYMSLIPPVKPLSKKYNFYLRGLEKVNPAQWYGKQVFGKNSIAKVVTKLLKSVNANGHFTNHSLRRTGATRLFQAGVDRKLIKEYTGHTSDAIDKYQITSSEQRQEISNVLHSEGKTNVECHDHDEVDTEKNAEVEPIRPSLELSVTSRNKKGEVYQGCECKKNCMCIGQNDHISAMIQQLMQTKGHGKAKVKIEIEFSD